VVQWSVLNYVLNRNTTTEQILLNLFSRAVYFIIYFMNLSEFSLLVAHINCSKYAILVW